jgi:hypothetical protein
MWQKENKDIRSMEQKIKDRSEKLGTAIGDDFRNPLLTRQQLEHGVNWLIRLGYEEKVSRVWFLTWMSTH